MKKRFIEFFNSLNAKENAEEYFHQLEKLHSTPLRFYHNLDHVKHCLDELESVKHLTENPDAIEMALWFHDAVYDTHASDNEEKSAEIALGYCKNLGLPQYFSENVKELVLLTKHNIVPKTIDGKIIVDVDLTELGASPQKFDLDVGNIRKEYLWVPKEQFRLGRKTILQSFLDRPSIYYSSFFRAKYEFQARKNLEGEIAKLSQAP